MQKGRFSSSTGREDINVSDGANQTPGDQVWAARVRRRNSMGDGLSVTQLTASVGNASPLLPLPSEIDA